MKITIPRILAVGGIVALCNSQGCNPIKSGLDSIKEGVNQHIYVASELKDATKMFVSEPLVPSHKKDAYKEIGYAPEYELRSIAGSYTIK